MTRTHSTLASWALSALLVLSACTGVGSDPQRTQPPAPTLDRANLPTTPQTRPTAVGECLSAADCQEFGPCAMGVCQDGQCGSIPVNGACDDGDPCTDKDQCTAGACQGAPIQCDDGVACTNDYCWGDGCTSVPSKDAHCEVKVTVIEPSRGATILGSGPITVSGHVSSPAGPLASLMVGDQQVVPEVDGTFSTLIMGHRGINVLEVVATDSFERTHRTVQSFAYGADAHPPGTTIAPTMIHKGIGLWLDASFFDDDNADLDDVAALALDILEDFDIGAALPHPLLPPGEELEFAFCSWNLDLTDVTHSVGPIEIQPVPGGLSLELELVDVSGFLVANSPSCPDVSGEVFLDSVQIETITSVGMAFQKGLKVEPESVEVTVTGLNLELQNLASLLNGIVNLVEAELEDIVAAQLEERVPEAVLPMVEGLMHGMTAYEAVVNIDSPIPEVAPLEVMYRIEPGDLSFNNEGAVLSLRVGVSALKGVSHPSPGSLVLGSCDISKGVDADLCCATAPGVGCVQDTCEACVCAKDDHCCSEKWDALCANHAATDCDASCGCSESGAAAMNLDLDRPIEAYLSENVVNQLLFAMWWGGQLAVTLDGDELMGDVEGVNISDLQLHIDPILPPVVTTCGPADGLELQVGDIRAEASFNLNGTPASFSLYTSLHMGLGLGVEVTPEGGGELSVEPQEVSLFEYELISTEGMGTIGEVVIDGMMDNLMQKYLVTELVTGLTKAYPIPIVDISPWVSGLSSGSKLTVIPQAVTWEPGQLHLGGEVREP